ncbi:MAG TPA: sialidase family protein [Cellulomonas sp.]
MAHTCVIHRGSVGETGSMYTRLLVTDPDGPNEGAVLLTWELRLGVADPAGPVFPVHRSTDGGRTWAAHSTVPDTAYGFGNRYQPVLYELPAALGHLPRGAILLAGNAIPGDGSSTHLVVYSSVDGGATWRYESTVDSGGPAVYSPERFADTTAVWEPDLALVDGVLHCCFADEREKAAGMLQVIARRSTTDLRTWSAKDVVCGVPDRWRRPGMFVATSRMPDGRYRAVIEVVGPYEVPIHLLESDDGVHWGTGIGRHLISRGGVALSGTPNIAWHAEPDGTVVLLATGRHTWEDGHASNRALVSFDQGATWDHVDLPTPAERHLHGDAGGYSQSVRWNAAGELLHATTVRNLTGSHDVVVTVAPAPTRKDVR